MQWVLPEMCNSYRCIENDFSWNKRFFFSKRMILFRLLTLKTIFWTLMLPNDFLDFLIRVYSWHRVPLWQDGQTRYKSQIVPLIHENRSIWSWATEGQRIPSGGQSKIKFTFVGDFRLYLNHFFSNALTSLKNLESLHQGGQLVANSRSQRVMDTVPRLPKDRFSQCKTYGHALFQRPQKADLR